MNARRRKTKVATPAWADLDAIRTRYKERATMERLTGVRHDVDHVIPLCGDNVCGLHVAANLRVILGVTTEKAITLPPNEIPCR